MQLLMPRTVQRMLYPHTLAEAPVCKCGFVSLFVWLCVCKFVYVCVCVNICGCCVGVYACVCERQEYLYVILFQITAASISKEYANLSR